LETMTPIINTRMSLGAGGTIWAEKIDGTKVLVATLNLDDLTVPEAFGYAEAFINGVRGYPREVDAP
jgi:hypothetical protein